MDRRTMTAGLDEWMRTGSVHFQDTGRHQSGRPLVKSYLIEANAPEVENAARGVRSFFERIALPVRVTVVDTNDPTLHQLLVGKKNDLFFLDTLDPRFWVLHSTAHASAADHAVNTLVHKTRFLDAFWLPSKQLQDWSGRLGVLRSMTAKFAIPHGLYDESVADEAFLNESLLLRLGARGDATHRWDRLSNTSTMAPYLALWSNKVHQIEPDDDAEAYSDVTAAGKIISRGTSFRLHEQLAFAIRNQYAQVITDIELRYRISWNRNDAGIRPSGDVLTLPFPEPMVEESLERLVVNLFNGTEPYRLFGIPNRQGDNRFSIKAIDLHTGDKIDIELTQSFLRLYLHSMACGNVVTRLVTNLQHSVDARIALPALQA